MQRVSEAAVSVDDDLVAAIGPGLLVLAGVATDDHVVDAEVAADKITGLRVFADGKGLMNRSILEAGGEVLVVSQFTLLGDARRGRRPSFTDAADPDLAASVLERLAQRLVDNGVSTRTGRFGAQMEVSLVNDGPVTLVLEIREGRVL